MHLFIVGVHQQCSGKYYRLLRLCEYLLASYKNT